MLFLRYFQGLTVIVILMDFDFHAAPFRAKEYDINCQNLSTQFSAIIDNDDRFLLKKLNI